MNKKIQLKKEPQLSRPSKEVVLLQVPSVFEDNACERFEVLVAEALAIEARVVVVDCSAAESISTVMLGLLLKLRHGMTGRDGEVRLAEVHPRVRRVLSICRLDQLFNVFSTSEAALKVDEATALV
jgi:anti-anti-sigma factor